jgi:hypothetical protein
VTSVEKLPVKSVSKSNDLSNVIDLTGKFGSKWRHGYIPLNAAARALKLHKNPGNISKRGRFADADSKDKAKLLEKHGGYSLNGHGHSPKSGYMVSYDEKHGGIESVIEGKVAPSDIYRHKGALQAAHSARKGRMSSPLDSPSNYHGAWKDSESGKTYLDVSRNHRSLEKAALAAQSMGQLAIYDVKNQKSINTADALKMAAKEKRSRAQIGEKLTSTEQRFTAGKMSKDEHTVMVLGSLRSSGKYNPDAGSTNSAKPSIADTIKSVEADYGSDRSKWPASVLKAAAPYDAVAQIHLNKIGTTDYKAGRPKARKTPLTASQRHAHKTNTGLDWKPDTADDSSTPSRNVQSIFADAGWQAPLATKKTKQSTAQKEAAIYAKRKAGKKVSLANESISKKKARKKLKNHLEKVNLRLSQADLAITPGGRVGDASPLGKKGSKRKLSDYEREVAHALMRKRGIPKAKAIPMARGIIRNAATKGKWGKGRASANVKAGAAASIAQRKSFTNNRAQEMDLAVAKWHHGWIPANSAAELIAGARVRPRLIAGVDKRRDPGLGRKGRIVSVAHQPLSAKRVKDVKVKWDDGTTSVHDSMFLDVKAIASQTSLSNDVDLAAKWHHGWVPANAEAMAIVAARKKKGPRSTSLAHAGKYHAPTVKATMSQTDLRQHANLHTAAAGRARSEASKMKHTAEAKDALDHIAVAKAHRVGKPTASSGSLKQRGAHATGPKSGRGKAAPKKGEKGYFPKDDYAQEDDVDPAAKAPVMKLTAKQLNKELSHATKVKDAARVRELNKEKAKRVTRLKKLKAEHDAAAKFVDTAWDSLDKNDPKKVSAFLSRITKHFPAAKGKLNKLKDKEGKISGIKNAEAFKIILSEIFREVARQVSGPILATGIGSAAGALGIGVLKVKAGG